MKHFEQYGRLTPALQARDWERALRHTWPDRPVLLLDGKRVVAMTIMLERPGLALANTARMLHKMQEATS